MFAVMYQGYVYPETEKDYQKLWHQIAQYFIEHRGAKTRSHLFGSVLPVVRMKILVVLGGFIVLFLLPV